MKTSWRVVPTVEVLEFDERHVCLLESGHQRLSAERADHLSSPVVRRRVLGRPLLMTATHGAGGLDRFPNGWPWPLDEDKLVRVSGLFKAAGYKSYKKLSPEGKKTPCNAGVLLD